MVIDLLLKRKSFRSFSDQPVEAAKLEKIFEAARLAPSSMNEQPWRFVYRSRHSNPEAFSELLNTLSEGNQRWAAKAPLFIAVITRPNFYHKNLANRHYLYDTGQAVSNMILQLTELDLVARQMGGFDPDRARAVLNVGNDFEIAVIIAVGYAGNAEELPDDLQKKESAPRSRKDLNEITFENKMP